MKKILLNLLTPQFVIALGVAAVVSLWYPKAGLALAGISPFLTGLGSITFQSAFGLLSWAGGAWSTVASAANVNLTPTQFVGAGETNLTITGAQGAGFNVNTPSAFQMVQYLTQILGFTPPVGFTWQFIVINSATTQTLTLVGGTGVTINGTATAATNTTREWLVTIANNTLLGSQAALTLQSIQGGTV